MPLLTLSIEKFQLSVRSNLDTSRLYGHVGRGFATVVHSSGDTNDRNKHDADTDLLGGRGSTGKSICKDMCVSPKATNKKVSARVSARQLYHHNF